jgi:hypothetical protein
MAFSALSFFFVIIVPLLSYDEPNVSLIQNPSFVRLSLTANTEFIKNAIGIERVELDSENGVVKSLNAANNDPSRSYHQWSSLHARSEPWLAPS